MFVSAATSEGLYAKLVRRVVTELECPAWVALQAVGLIIRASITSRADYSLFFDKTRPEVEAVVHRILPLRQFDPPPGSIHALINQLVLQPGEVSICRVGFGRDITLLLICERPEPDPVSGNLEHPLDFRRLQYVHPYGAKLLVELAPWSLPAIPLLLSMRHDRVVVLDGEVIEDLEGVLRSGSWWDNIGRTEPLAPIYRRFLIVTGPRWDHGRFTACLRGNLSKLGVHLYWYV